MSDKQSDFTWVAIYDIESGAQTRLSPRPSAGRPGSPVVKVVKSYMLSQEEVNLVDAIAFQLNQITPFTTTKSQVVGLSARLLLERIEAIESIYPNARNWPEFASLVFSGVRKANGSHPWAQLYEAEMAKSEHLGKRVSKGRPRSGLKKYKKTFRVSTDDAQIIENLGSRLSEALPLRVTYSQVVAVAIRFLDSRLDLKKLKQIKVTSWTEIVRETFEVVDNLA